MFACIEMVSSNVILKASILCMHGIESNVFVVDCRGLDFDDSSHTAVLLCMLASERLVVFTCWFQCSCLLLSGGLYLSHMPYSTCTSSYPMNQLQLLSL